MAIDLHVHSTASDGTVPPEILPEMAAQAGLTAVALTDHDTVDGLEAFLGRQDEFPQTELIAGVELSSCIGARELHIVGLFIDPHNSYLQDFMQRMRRDRIDRALAMLEKLRSLGYELTWDDLLSIGMSDNVPGRPHFAQALIKKYNFPDTVTVFAQLLKRGAPGYAARNLPPPSEAIIAIKKAGGTAVWAHPFSSRNNENNFARRNLNNLKNAGLDALEAYYSEYTPTQTANALRIAQEFSLSVSGGSDYHGSIHPDVQLGRGRGNLEVPDELTDILRRAGRPKVVIMQQLHEAENPVNKNN